MSEEIDFNRVDFFDEQLTEQDYSYQCLQNTNKSLLTDDAIERNRALIDSMIEGYYYLNNQDQKFPPKVVGKILDVTFISIKTVGYR